MSASTPLSKQEQSYSILRGRIRDGTYGPGHRLVIDALARELNVSPLPIREAIRRLEAEGWVVYRRNSGAHVTPVDSTLWVEGMTTFALLEGFVTRLAAPELTPEDLERLHGHNDRLRTAIGRGEINIATTENSAFHAVFAERCPNTYLRRQLDVTVERLGTVRRTIFTMIPNRTLQVPDEHDQLLVLIENGADPDEIEAFAREHKLRTVRSYEEHWATLEAASDSGEADD
jgi:DNA-binding GntR family transcriptional regulator